MLKTPIVGRSLILATIFTLAAFAASAALMTAKTMETSIGTVLTDPRGMTLYTFDKDGMGTSSCTGGCAQNWPPFAAPADAQAHDDWTVISRDDGSKQWAYKGKPLYLWSKDMKAGDVGGNGFKDVWHAAKP